MYHLSIQNFSCVASAEVELGRLTVITGPQSSGKSLITKIINFFNDIIGSLWLSSLERGNSVRNFQILCSQEFLRWFPPQTWGKSQFLIQYECDEISITASRRDRKDEPQVVFEFSSLMSDIYEATSGLLRRKRPSSIDDLFAEEEAALQQMHSARRYRDEFLERAAPNATQYQLFVPAARSFFTSVTKAFAVFEAGGYLDPITLRFGKSFLLWTDRSRASPRQRRIRSEVFSRFDEYLRRLLGGRLHIGRDERHITSSDGRKIPFHLLSSGQQELIPLWLALEAFFGFPRDNSLITIEEPEAHLFPNSQAMLMEILVDLLNSSDASNRMIITTHSPYILSELNILIKRSSLHSRAITHGSDALARKIVKTSLFSSEDDGSVVSPDFLKAYGIVDKRLTSIFDDETGLISAEYLDEISFDAEDRMSRLFAYDYEMSGR